jgi:hypothetical protein
MSARKGEYADLKAPISHVILLITDARRLTDIADTTYGLQNYIVGKLASFEWISRCDRRATTSGLRERQTLQHLYGQFFDAY